MRTRLLEDVLTSQQAIEMSTSTLRSFRHHGRVCFDYLEQSQHQMKVLTSITIVMSIPTIVSSFYGMNVRGMPLPVFWFPMLLSVVGMVIVGVVLMKKNMF
ncbi:MAG: CorA family divalent cation transporter [Oscillospiraceae bacterium]